MAYRIGVDVGGTFTDAVAVDTETMALVGAVKVPTTHHHSNGVAEGIRLALERLMDVYRIRPEDVVFIAHGTTQATNALLEGDVEPVGVLSVGEGIGAGRVKKETSFTKLELSAGKSIRVHSLFVRRGNVDMLGKAIHALESDGIRSVVAASAYSVDDPGPEQTICSQASERGLYCTATHEMSGLYGLRTRTKTAIINASILPGMVETADYMMQSVRRTGIRKPLMIMRSDGGVMGAEEVKRRPIQTILSGPASGVAGALLYGNVSEGVFLEVGGTSTDISAIHNGQVSVKWAQIGTHKTYVNSLDIRTVAVAGGSMLRLENGRVTCGPRSAHIAGAQYCCFAENMHPERLRLGTYRVPGDAVEYLILRDEDTEEMYALTLTCLANYAGYVSEDDFCRGNALPVKAALELLAEYLGKPIGDILEEVFSEACRYLAPVIRELVQDYHLTEKDTVLIGGGGGCSAVVPVIAERMGLRCRKCPEAQVISPIGVAMAMIREVVERTVVAPTEDDLQKLKEEAAARAVQGGAVRDSVEVVIERDPLRNLLRAVATGVTDRKLRTDTGGCADRETLLALLKEREDLKDCVLTWDGGNSRFHLFQFKKKDERRWRDLFRRREEHLFVLAADGSIKLHRRRGAVKCVENDKLEQMLDLFLDEHCEYGDMGESLPDVFLVTEDRLFDYSMIRDRKALMEQACFETRRYGEKGLVFLVCGL